MRANGGQDGIYLFTDEGPCGAVGGVQCLLVVVPGGFEVGGVGRGCTLVAFFDECEGVGGDGSEFGDVRGGKCDCAADRASDCVSAMEPA